MTCTTEIPRQSAAPDQQAVNALAHLGVLGRQLGPSSWEASLPCDQVSTGRVRIDAGTIRLSAPLIGTQSPPDQLWEILCRNASAGPGVRFGLSAGQRIILIGEILIENVPDIESRMTRLVADMASLDRTADEQVTATPADIAALCQEAGWDFTRRDDAIHVRLEANRHGIGIQAAAIPFSASVNFRSGMLRCEAELVSDDKPPQDPNRAAVAALLLHVSTQIRLVRPAVAIVDGQSAVIFESRLLSNISAWELGQAISALSVAVRICGPEASALYRDANLARSFLRIRFPGFVGPGFLKCLE